MVMTNDSRVELQPAFVLHQRAYRDSSAIVELFSRDFGRVAVVAKGVRGSKSKLRGVLQTFSGVNVSWTGRGELKTLTAAEAFTQFTFSGFALVGALYINEILLRVLPKFDPLEDLFVDYQLVLSHLSVDNDIEVQLRFFEKVLLEALGYELNLICEANTGEPLADDGYYFYLPDHGPVRASLHQTGQSETFKGCFLRAFAENDFSAPETRKLAKRITRQALKPLIGSQPLKSRELYVSLYKMPLLNNAESE